jgi:hypothetical protein
VERPGSPPPIFSIGAAAFGRRLEGGGAHGEHLDRFGDCTVASALPA